MSYVHFTKEVKNERGFIMYAVSREDPDIGIKSREWLGSFPSEKAAEAYIDLIFPRPSDNELREAREKFCNKPFVESNNAFNLDWVANIVHRLVQLSYENGVLNEKLSALKAKVEHERGGY